MPDTFLAFLIGALFGVGVAGTLVQFLLQHHSRTQHPLEILGRYYLLVPTLPPRRSNSAPSSRRPGAM